MSKYTLSSRDVAMGPPGLVSPFNVIFSPDSSYLTYLYPDSTGNRQVFFIKMSANLIPEMAFNTEASEELSKEEQLRRERMRQFARGIISYEWVESKEDKRQLMMIPLNGQILVSTFGEKIGNLRVAYDGGKGAAIDPHWSPDGTKIAFVISRDLYVIDVFYNDEVEDVLAIPRRLTFAGDIDAGISCGLADYIAQEEMDRYRGFWWSPDSLSIAYTVVDERHIPEYTIMHQGETDPTHSETHRYPFAGAKNPRVRLAVADVYLDLTLQGPPSPALPEGSSNVGIFPPVDISGSVSVVGNVTPVSAETSTTSPEESEEETEEVYLGRVGWWPDGSVMAQVLDRRQSRLQLLRIDPRSGEASMVLEERSDVWVNLRDMCHPLTAGWRPKTCTDTFGADDWFCLWASERSGFCLLYLVHYDAERRCGRLLGGPVGGGGNFVVDSIDGVDEAAGLVYFSSSRLHDTQKHLYAATLEPSAGMVCLTMSPGCHSTTVCVGSGGGGGGGGGGVYVDTFSSVSQPPVTDLRRLPSPSDLLTALAAAAEDEDEGVDEVLEGDLLQQLASGAEFGGGARLGMVRPALCCPEIQTISALDGTPLHCVVYRPDESIYGPGPYPTVVAVYGGPHVQRVTDCWPTTVDMRCQRQRQDGVLVLKCDNRGSYRRGLRFEGAIKGDMGNVEIEDQAIAVRHFVSEGSADPSRVGMIGWSYGGYMSALAVCRAPDVFCCGVAGAPVVRWEAYDTCYTERYMGLPQENAEGYEEASVTNHVENMGDNKLMLIHGLIDENVHFRHTAQLLNALVEHQKSYDLLLFPCERHCPHALDGRMYVEDRVDAFFRQHLRMTVTDASAAAPVPVLGGSQCSSSPSTPAADEPSANTNDEDEDMSAKISAHL